MDCPVCYNDVTVGNKRTLECSHSLCVTCLNKLQNLVCPLCRAPITDSKVQKTEKIPTVLDNLSLRDKLDMFRKPLWKIIPASNRGNKRRRLKKKSS